jgi:hypothetical protein
LVADAPQSDNDEGEIPPTRLSARNDRLSTLLRALLKLVSKWNLAALARLLFQSAICSRADIDKAAEAIWPWLRGLPEETQQR